MVRIKTLLQHSAAFLVALRLSLSYFRMLRVRRSEAARYLRKSVSLAMCYVGFGGRQSLAEAARAGEAGFYCCAYDVVTDWRGFEEESWRIFVKILRKRKVEDKLVALAFKLHQKESDGALADDGLERGSIALRCVLGLMRSCRKQICADVDKLGLVCQIVDDVLDYEDDLRRGDPNCLQSENRAKYLDLLISTFTPIETTRLFGADALVLRIAIKTARQKALELRRAETGTAFDSVTDGCY